MHEQSKNKVMFHYTTGKLKKKITEQKSNHKMCDGAHKNGLWIDFSWVEMDCGFTSHG